MSVYPLMLDGRGLAAVIAGGGRVATRRAAALLAAGARVHVVAPDLSDALQAMAAEDSRLRLTRAEFTNEHFDDALLVVVATGDPAADERIAAEARARGRLVNVAGAPDLGNCVVPAVHRAGDVVLAVSANRVPTAAVRIRDRLAAVLDQGYSGAVAELARLRAALLGRGDRTRWQRAAESLTGADFCDAVESGDFPSRMAAWR